MYSYRDFATQKLKHTRGKFSHWENGGPLNVRYAVFANRCSDVLVPEYSLTAETKRKITLIEEVRKNG